MSPMYESCLLCMLGIAARLHQVSSHCATHICVCHTHMSLAPLCHTHMSLDPLRHTHVSLDPLRHTHVSLATLTHTEVCSHSGTHDSPKGYRIRNVQCIAAAQAFVRHTARASSATFRMRLPFGESKHVLSVYSYGIYSGRIARQSISRIPCLCGLVAKKDLCSCKTCVKWPRVNGNLKKDL
jgi:hypothetical protein